MSLTVAPFIIEPKCNCISSFGYEQEEHIRQYHVPITYWRGYLNDKHVSYDSNRKLAEETKLWMEKWFKN